MKSSLLALGIFSVLIGLVWIGQGTGYFPYPRSSFMINETSWVYWGIAVVFAGIVVILASRRV